MLFDELRYIIFYYGLSKGGIKNFSHITSFNFSNVFSLMPLLTYLMNKPTRSNGSAWNEWISNKDDILYVNNSNNYIKYYGGQQHRLEHYIRNILYIVKLISNSNYSEIDKKYYLDILKSQLTNSELIILFLHTISIVGRDYLDGLIIEKKYIEYLFNNINSADISRFNVNSYFGGVRI